MCFSLLCRRDNGTGIGIKTCGKELQEFTQKFGFIAIGGLPNVGKSSLLNRLLADKVAAVSRKPQTTRFNILAVKEFGETQVAFVDTPGLATHDNPVAKFLRKSSSSALRNADAVVFVVDVSSKDGDPSLKLAETLIRKYENAQFMVAFNKIDKVKPARVVEVASAYQKLEAVKDFFMMSAIQGRGVDVLLECILSAIPEQKWLYPPQNGKNLVRWTSEMTMEKVFENLHNEVPYQTYVNTVAMQEDSDGLHIYQDVVVAKSGQKAIVLGKNGQILKKMGMDARIDIARVLKRRVHLHLLVKVKEDWMSKTSSLMDAGFIEN
jgi:GTP-binding protein Era